MSGWTALRSRGTSPLWNVTSLLMLFTLAFAAATAVGRICIGMEAAESSRYIPYSILGFLGLYIALRGTERPGWRRTAALAVFVAACAGKERAAQVHAEAEYESNAKRVWHDCYLARHDIAACNAAAPRAIYPAPDATRLQEKLDWLEDRGYGLFRTR